MTTDPTRIDISTDPTRRRMTGVAYHGNTPFDVPYISEVADGLWQGGCETGMILPGHIQHVISLYPWERYTVRHELKTELYIRMLDSEGQGLEGIDHIAGLVNYARAAGGDVLVHCQAGLNRSALITARALFLNNDFYAQEIPYGGELILKYLRDKRSLAVLCNPHFEKAVRSWA